jgi:hypothetical protein
MTTSPVGWKSGIVLKVAQRELSLLAKDRIHSSGVKAQRGESMLQVSDVVAAKHWPTEIQESIAEPVAGPDNGRPGACVTDSV